MKAIVYTKYGGSEVLKLEDVERPIPKFDEVLIRVHAVTVNRTDCATIRAKPFFMRLITGIWKPKRKIPGTDYAGVVEVVGSCVTSLKTGDRVLGFNDEGSGSHAQYAAVKEAYTLPMPANLTYAQAAASSEGAHYAYNFIDKINLEKGQRVLVNGATGAIGSAAVQILRHRDVQVTAVCSGNNSDLVRSLGVDRVIDYTKADFTDMGQKYDFVFDAVGKSSFFKCKEILEPGGAYISSDLGYLAQNIFLPWITAFVKPVMENKKSVFPTPRNIRRTLLYIQPLLKEGKFVGLIDREYPFEQIAEAYRYVEKGRKLGNVVIRMD